MLNISISFLSCRVFGIFLHKVGCLEIFKL